jgi:hypothetical protein
VSLRARAVLGKVTVVQRVTARRFVWRRRFEWLPVSIPWRQISLHNRYARRVSKRSIEIRQELLVKSNSVRCLYFFEGTQLQQQISELRKQIENLEILLDVLERDGHIVEAERAKLQLKKAKLGRLTAGTGWQASSN